MTDTPTDPHHCPLCGQANACRIAADKDSPHCWCFDESIGVAALAKVPAADRGRACICRTCARQVQQDSNEV